MKIYLINSESYRLANEKINEIIKDSVNIVKFDLGSSTLEDIVTEASYLSMFQEEKFIIVKNANFFGSMKINENDLDLFIRYLENPNPLSNLIFVCNEKLDARKKITKIFKEKYQVISIPNLKVYEIENKIGEFFKKNQYTYDINSVKYLVQNSLNNYDIALSEAEKVLLYYNHPCPILYKDLENILSKPLNSNQFLFIDALIDRNLSRSLQLLKELKILKVEPIALLSLIARDIRIMLQIKMMLEEKKNHYEIMSTMKLMDWQLDKYLKKVFTYKISELESLLVKLSNLDLDIKSGKKDKFIALELLILDICE